METFTGSITECKIMVTLIHGYERLDEQAGLDAIVCQSSANQTGGHIEGGEHVIATSPVEGFERSDARAQRGMGRDLADASYRLRYLRAVWAGR